MISQFLQDINLVESLFRIVSFVDILPLLQSILDCDNPQENVNIWTLEHNRSFSVRSFSVRSFYKFLVEGGTHSPLHSNFWKMECPSKMTLFCWLARENRILTLVNLTKKGCNLQNAIDTCVLCYKDSKIVDHLLISCEFLEHIWSFFKLNLNIQSLPPSLSEVWTTWIPFLEASYRVFLDLPSKAIF